MGEETSNCVGVWAFLVGLGSVRLGPSPSRAGQQLGSNFHRELIPFSDTGRFSSHMFGGREDKMFLS